MIRDNIISLNYNTGMTLHTVTNATIKNNEIAMNYVDGLVVSWNSHTITIDKNYIHHHLFWGHPDNIQFFRNVSNITMSDNLIMNSGQGLMSEECDNCRFTGNMVIGTQGNMAAIGNSTNWEVANNTFAYTGLSIMRLSAKGYNVRNNIFVTGNSNGFYGVRSSMGYIGDHNVFWHGPGLGGRSTTVTTEKAWHTNLPAYQKASGQDAASTYADPLFDHAPTRFTVIDSNRIADCENSSVILLSDIDANIGDWIEINFDGLKRRVTAANGKTLSFEPALRERPLKSWLIANWKDKDDFNLDLHVSKSSPARKDDQQAIGSTINLQQYRNGDFDGDGKRDLPDTLPQMQDVIDSFR